ncbi:MAG: MerR family transcriptional regulator [Bacillota bacterium]|nr:MerR family transcriptional regulator [Bacillota bacterium]
MEEDEEVFSIGELAQTVGISVRTLQYYDRINLLSSKYTEGGRRIYTRKDIFNLQQILFFKSLGFSLNEIKENVLKQDSLVDLINVFTSQRNILSKQIENLGKIAETLDIVIAEAKTGKEITVEKLMTILILMKEGNPYSFIIRYFNEEQMAGISKRFDSQDKYYAFMQNAKEVFTKLEILNSLDADPAGAEGQKLAKQWWDMVNEFAAGNSDMLSTLIMSGKDIDNWPIEAKKLKEPIKNFLTKAFSIYLENNNIHISDIGVKNHE